MTTTRSRSDQKMLTSWTPDRQQQYRERHPQQVLTFHFLLDASPSMIGQDAVNLTRSFNMYLAWLQRHADPMSLAELALFSTPLTRHPVQPLGSMTPLTTATYDPREGNGTALYRAVGEVATTPVGTGQHVLITFTDGYDNRSDECGWSAGQVCSLLTTLQEQHGWLCVFLGAMADALGIGASMGFTPGNCLEFTTDRIPEAFQRLTQATQKYLTAAPAHRKLLAAGGIF